MRRRHVPVRMARSFVEVDAVVYAQLHFIECIGEIEVRWRVITRVAAQDDKQLDCAAMHFLDEIAQRDPVSG